MEQLPMAQILDCHITVAITNWRNHVKGAITIQSRQPIIQRTLLFSLDPLTDAVSIGPPDTEEPERYPVIVRGMIELVQLVYHEAALSLVGHVLENIPAPKEFAQ